ncbi:hypothetical protein F4778DRAFT_781640 [Xylariomycetidae sp. FL2044]|nr:hypothetical protein F4778DRAFT_781640 [Xylariomycetidae sp. FL2044]
MATAKSDIGSCPIGQLRMGMSPGRDVSFYHSGFVGPSVYGRNYDRQDCPYEKGLICMRREAAKRIQRRYLDTISKACHELKELQKEIQPDSIWHEASAADLAWPLVPHSEWKVVDQCTSIALKNLRSQGNTAKIEELHKYQNSFPGIFYLDRLDSCLSEITKKIDRCTVFTAYWNDVHRDDNKARYFVYTKYTANETPDARAVPIQRSQGKPSPQQHILTLSVLEENPLFHMDVEALVQLWKPAPKAGFSGSWEEYETRTPYVAKLGPDMHAGKKIRW